MGVNLPRPRTVLFGRQRSLARIENALREHQAVTVTGTGGVGKTRLALQAAEAAAPKLADRVAWVELASVSDPELLATTICGALGIHPTASLSPLEVLVRRLRRGAWLLILDNCEHLREACGGLVSALIEYCPRLRVLVTSREALGIVGEVLCPITPLNFPKETEEADAEKVLASTAVQLFADRVRAASPDFAVTLENAADIARLCRKLDGIPLALEIAAARVGVLTVTQITERLGHGLDLLKRTDLQAPPRHQTMRAALDWSHALLTDVERALFRRLAVFGGGVDIEACEAICAGDGLDPRAVLDALTGLIGKSLLTTHEGQGRARYRLLEPVRQFALEQLEASGEGPWLRRQYARHYAVRAEALAANLHGSGRTAALEMLEHDHDNFRLAWDHAMEARDATILARLAGALFWFWHFHGHFVEGRHRAERALECLGAEAARAGTLVYAAGAMAWMQGDYEVARKRLEACVAALAPSGNQALRGIALRELAGVRFTLGDLAGAAECYDAGIGQLREAGDRWGLALALVMQADMRGRAGDAAAAQRLLEEARDTFGEVSDPWGLALVCFELGWSAAREGNADTARAQLGKALALQHEAGDPWNIGQVLMLMGEVEEQTGNDEAAATHYCEALAAFREVGDRVSIAYGIARLVGVELRRGNARQAARLAGAAQALDTAPDAVYPYALAANDQLEAFGDALRNELGQRAFNENWAAGQSLTADEAVAMSLEGGSIGDGQELARPLTAVDAALQVFALGGAEVYREAHRLRAADWTFALPQALFFYLLVEGPCSKAQIGLEFWPDASEKQLKGRFRTTLYQLRRAIGGTEWVCYQDGRYAFNCNLDYWFDVETFDAALEQAAGAPDPEAAAAALEQAIELYRGDFLEGLAAGSWADRHRERLQRRYRESLLALGKLRGTAGADESAAHLYRRAVELDDLDESAHRALAGALVRLGDRSGALRQLDALAERLREELGAEPSAETRALRARLQA